jgi:SAM-dependent methyltransferase
MHQLARHSLPILETIRQYDTFLESIRHVADLGSGTGEDVHWWATLENYNDPPEPYNFNCFAVDNNADRLSQVPKLKNIHTIHDIYDRPNLFPVSIDLIWAHNSLTYSLNPLETLRMWNSYMTVNGMLLLSVPQHTGVEHNRFYSRGYNGCYYHFNPISLIYMLAVNGFDCRDAYLIKKFQDPWINVAVYKSDIGPMDPLTTTWYDLIDKKLLHPTIVDSINANGFLKQEEICMPWLDKELYFIDYQSTKIEFPPPIETNGAVNETVKSNKTTIAQASPKSKETKILKPLVIKSIPPTRRSYKHGE